MKYEKQFLPRVIVRHQYGDTTLYYSYRSFQVVRKSILPCEKTRCFKKYYNTKSIKQIYLPLKGFNVAGLYTHNFDITTDICIHTIYNRNFIDVTLSQIRTPPGLHMAFHLTNVGKFCIADEG